MSRTLLSNGACFNPAKLVRSISTMCSSWLKTKANGSRKMSNCPPHNLKFLIGHFYALNRCPSEICLVLPFFLLSCQQFCLEALINCFDTKNLSLDRKSHSHTSKGTPFFRFFFLTQKICVLKASTSFNKFGFYQL